MWELYGLDLTVVHSNSIHIPVDKLSQKANPNFIGSWEMILGWAQEEEVMVLLKS